MYDDNNNCLLCDEYIYDQHKTFCPKYVDETYLEFTRRIMGENPDVKGYNDES